MTRVTADLLDGEVRLSSKGDTARRVYQVRELTGAASQRLALAARASEVPRVGDAHPVIGGISVLDVTARATDDPTIAVVEVAYGIPDAADLARTLGAADVSINASLITEETTRDIDGNFLRTTWTFRFTSTDAGDPNGDRRVNEAELTRAIHRVEVQKPTFSVQFSRIETEAPLQRTFAYSGRVNASTFLGEPPDRFLCTVTSSQQGPREHRVTYSFTHNPVTWQAVLTHTVDGVIPSDLTADGVQVRQVYPRANFAALGLPRL